MRRKKKAPLRGVAARRENALALLGKPVADKFTGLAGIADAVCINAQGVVTVGIDWRSKDGALMTTWVAAARVERSDA